MAMYDNENTVEKSFDLNYVSAYLIQAQWAEFIELKKVIQSLANRQRTPISILDIGIGNARIVTNLVEIKELWNLIENYDGTDNAQACIDISTKVIAESNMQNKVKTYFFDAINLDKWSSKYDLIISTWFTPGNFYPFDFSFKKYASQTEKLNLDKNENFTTIFKNAYSLLKPGGELLLGACYIDNDSTRLKQEAAYIKMGMEIITSPSDSFTATVEGFWSQRFTIPQLYNYLNFASADKITITPLDTYDYAMQVSIKK